MSVRYGVEVAHPIQFLTVNLKFGIVLFDVMVFELYPARKCKDPEGMQKLFVSDQAIPYQEAHLIELTIKTGCVLPFTSILD